MKISTKFNGTQIREVETAKNEITIGRGLENDVLIDNLAVSNVHARIVTLYLSDTLKIPPELPINK